MNDDLRIMDEIRDELATFLVRLGDLADRIALNEAESDVRSMARDLKSEGEGWLFEIEHTIRVADRDAIEREREAERIEDIRREWA